MPEEDPAPTPELDEQLVHDLVALSNRKLDAKREKEDMDLEEARLVKELQALQVKSAPIVEGLIGTVVTGKTVAYDLDELLVVDPDLYAAVTKTSIDSDRWKKAEKMGLVTDAVRARAVRTKPNKPYILFGSPAEETSDE